MSVGTFSDRATKIHLKQTTKQKKVVFGERPLTICAQQPKLPTGNQNANNNPNDSSLQTQPTTDEQQADANKLKGNTIPWYIISQDNSVLATFRICIGILSVPSVLLNLFFIAFGFDTFSTMRSVVDSMEIFFFAEIIVNFFTAYKDPENFDSVYSLKKIAQNYIIRGNFLPHVLAAFPYQLVWSYKPEDPNENILRNVLMFKLLRLARLSNDFIPDDTLLQLMQNFQNAESRDDRIANDRFIINVIKIVKQVLTTLVCTYFLGLLWYRFSDHWQKSLYPDEPEDTYFVVQFYLRPERHNLFVYEGKKDFEYELTPMLSDYFETIEETGLDELGRRMFGVGNMGFESEVKFGFIHQRLICCMYFALTTLSTVGYGDFYPTSLAEKIVGSVIEIFGVTFFSVLMNSFIEVVLSMKSSNFSTNEDSIKQWFKLIKRIKNQPDGGGKEISEDLGERIEGHFRYFWDNDRTAVLIDKKEYFDCLPFKIQEHIMCKFLFQDIIDKPAFKTFFKIGKEFDANFVYEVAFGFIPRQFKDTPEDRYILLEEGDVTEIYFILKGEWAIAYNGYITPSAEGYQQLDEDDSVGPDDMMKEGRLIAARRINYGYIGDYYVLSSKRSQFYYVALTSCEAFALSKQFMFKHIFKKFAGLHSEMLAEAFSRYIKEFRKPCGRKRAETLQKLNRKLKYSQIMTETMNRSQSKCINQALQKMEKPANVGELRRMNSRMKIFEKQDELRRYKDNLDDLNERASALFEHMKQINKLVNKKVMDMESAVTKSEAIFVDEINTLIKNKQEMSKLDRKEYVVAQQ